MTRNRHLRVTGTEALLWACGLEEMPFEVLLGRVDCYLINLQKLHYRSNHSVLQTKHKVEIPPPKEKEKKKGIIGMCN